MPMRALLLSLLLLPGLAFAEACVVHSQDEHVEVKICQQNRSIPSGLFRSGYCEPQLKDQKVDVSFVEQCPGGAFGVCSGARTSNMPYLEDIHYYGIASDARFLKPACEGQSQGQWITPKAD